MVSITGHPSNYNTISKCTSQSEYFKGTNDVTLGVVQWPFEGSPRRLVCVSVVRLVTQLFGGSLTPGSCVYFVSGQPNGPHVRHHTRLTYKVCSCYLGIIPLLHVTLKISNRHCKKERLLQYEDIIVNVSNCKIGPICVKRKKEKNDSYS